MVGSGSDLKRSIFEFLGIWTPESGDAIINLGDNAGAKKLIVKDSDGNVIGYLNSDGELSLELHARLKEVTEPSTPSSGYAVIYVDTADKNLKLKDDTGAVTDLTAPGPESATDYRDFTEQGSKPATPASNKWRIWVDATGKIHLIEDTGLDKLIVDADDLVTHVSNTMPSPYYRLNGVDDLITIPNNEALSFGNGTTDSPVSFHFKGILEEVSSFYIFEKFSGVNDEYIFATNASNLLGIRFYDESAGGYIGVQSTETLTVYEGKEITITITYDGLGISAGIKMYLNGVLLTIVDWESGSYTAMESLGEDLIIGESASFFSKGVFNSISIYNLELNLSEVTALYSGGSVSFKHQGASHTATTTGAFVIGKAYRIVNVGDTDFTAIGASANTIGIEFIATGVGGGTTGTANPIGVVVEFDGSTMGHKQWGDKQNALHGEVNGPTIYNESPVHTEKYVKTGIANTATALTDIHPAGYKLIAIRAKGSAALTVVKIGTSSGGEQIVASVSVGTPPVILTLVSTANDGYSESAADTIYAEHATAGETLDLTFIFQKVGL